MDGEAPVSKSKLRLHQMLMWLCRRKDVNTVKRILFSSMVVVRLLPK